MKKKNVLKTSKMIHVKVIRSLSACSLHASQQYLFSYLAVSQTLYQFDLHKSLLLASMNMTNVIRLTTKVKCPRQTDYPKNLIMNSFGKIFF